jgi:triacylglycerol lipase
VRRGQFEKGISEASAMMNQLGRLFSDWKPTLHQGEGPLVVFIHGLYATAGVFGPLRAEVERELRATTFSFSYGLGPGIVELSERVASHVREISRKPGHRDGLYLVGHSLGGLVATYAAHYGPLRGQVRGVVTLAAPFAGSARAFLVPGQAGRDIEPTHPLLAQLCKMPSTGLSCPQLTIVAEDDAMIEPGAFPSFGEHLSLRSVGHNGVLFDRRAQELVVSKLRAWMHR